VTATVSTVLRVATSWATDAARTRRRRWRCLKEQPGAVYMYGFMAFGELDWERYVWWGRSQPMGLIGIGGAAIRFLPLFEEGRLGRILRTIVPPVRRNADIAGRLVFAFLTPMRRRDS
jgi:hypothetical protein